VSFCILKRSPDSFVWDAPPLLRGGHYLFNEENSLRGANTVVDSNLARVKVQESVARLGDIYFQIFKLNGFSLSIEAHVLPVQMNTALNREGVELSLD
jgi:hypothetical protein